MERNLVDEVRQKIVERHGGRADVSKIPVPQATVLLIDWVDYRVNNGGFRYLFESDPPGDPTLKLAIAAHDRIGATKAADAMRAALAVFFWKRLPKSISRRIRTYTSRYSLMDSLTGSTPDSLYWESSEETRRLLEEYVRKNESSFDAI